MSKKVPFECPVCGAKKYKVKFFKSSSYGDDTPLMVKEGRCKNCTATFTDPNRFSVHRIALELEEDDGYSDGYYDP
jgi:hypothetical protein